MNDLMSLYQDVILDHNKNPRNQHAITDPDAQADGYNPLCGDQLSLYITLDNDVITDAAFKGCGCAISTASASLMTEYLKGRRVEEAESMFQDFQASLTKDDSQAQSRLGKLKVLLGVKTFPARVKCATLAWHTLHNALQNEATTASTE